MPHIQAKLFYKELTGFDYDREYIFVTKYIGLLSKYTNLKERLKESQYLGLVEKLKEIAIKENKFRLLSRHRMFSKKIELHSSELETIEDDILLELQKKKEILKKIEIHYSRELERFQKEHQVLKEDLERLNKIHKAEIATENEAIKLITEEIWDTEDDISAIENIISSISTIHDYLDREDRSAVYYSFISLLTHLITMDPKIGEHEKKLKKDLKKIPEIIIKKKEELKKYENVAEANRLKTELLEDIQYWEDIAKQIDQKIRKLSKQK